MDCRDELLSFLRRGKAELNVVVMPDFFLDRLVELECNVSRFSSMVKDVTERKGGSIDDITQEEIRGGNAINTASALASLGVTVIPIVCTNRLGLQQINFHLKPYYIDTSHVKVLNKASLTTALEIKTKEGKANVMLRDLGSLADFGPANLTEADYEQVEGADYVCLFNWAGTRNFGTELAQAIFKNVKAKGKGKTYYDTADPASNQKKIGELMEKVLRSSLVDVLSLNENEAVSYAAFVDDRVCEHRGKLRFDELAMESARILAKRLSARIDLHTTRFSSTFTKKSEVVVPAFKIKALRATGAGDAWNAGNILADGNALSAECRLALANAVSACYLSDPEGVHPTREKLIKFIKNSTFQV
jgi:sugar/nucleoside kinase (ribokinase family)